MLDIKKDKTKMVWVRLTEDDYDYLEKLAQKNKTNISEIVRAIIKNYKKGE